MKLRFRVNAEHVVGITKTMYEKGANTEVILETEKKNFADFFDHMQEDMDKKVVITLLDDNDIPMGEIAFDA